MVEIISRKFKPGYKEKNRHNAVENGTDNGELWKDGGTYYT